MAGRGMHLLGDLVAVRVAVRASWRCYDAAGSSPRRCIVQIVEDAVVSPLRRREVLDELARFLPAQQRWSRAQSSIMRFDDAGRIDRKKVLKLVNQALRANGNVASIMLHAIKLKFRHPTALPSVSVVTAEKIPVTGM